MLPPSATVPVAVSVTVVVSIVSVMLVVAGALLTERFSKLPPLVPVMLADTLPASMSASSAGAATLMLADEAPAGMVMVWLFDSVTTRSVPAGLVSEAV